MVETNANRLKTLEEQMRAVDGQLQSLRDSTNKQLEDHRAESRTILEELKKESDVSRKLFDEKFELLLKEVQSFTSKDRDSQSVAMGSTNNRPSPSSPSATHAETPVSLPLPSSNMSTGPPTIQPSIQVFSRPSPILVSPRSELPRGVTTNSTLHITSPPSLRPNFFPFPQPISAQIPGNYTSVTANTPPTTLPFSSNSISGIQLGHYVPTVTPDHAIQTSSTNQTSPGFHKLPKLDFPSFEGDNPKSWVQKCLKYFSIYKVVDSQRVELASMFMNGRAETWYSGFAMDRGLVD